MTAAADPQIVPHQPAALPALRDAGQDVASALESVLSDNSNRVYATQWKIFDEWCGDMGLRSLPAEAHVARYLAARAGDGATSAITKAHQWAGHESPWLDLGAVPRQLYLPVSVNQFCRFTSLAWPRCWAALVR